jgi:hypothetical protein
MGLTNAWQRGRQSRIQGVPERLLTVEHYAETAHRAIATHETRLGCCNDLIFQWVDQCVQPASRHLAIIVQ